MDGARDLRQVIRVRGVGERQPADRYPQARHGRDRNGEEAPHLGAQQVFVPQVAHARADVSLLRQRPELKPPSRKNGDGIR